MLVALVLGITLFISSKQIILKPIARLTELSRRIANGEIFQSVGDHVTR